MTQRMRVPALQRRFSRLVGAAAVVAVGSLGASCKEADPAKYELDVSFPSTALAIAAEEVRFIVYEDDAPGACQRIYLKRITNQTDLPPVALEVPPVSVCDLAGGRMAPMELPLGKHAILAVALRGRQDLLVGCADVAISSEGGKVTVDLALPGTTPVPPLSSCLSLRDACDKRCL
jgi:hypothetical protein